MVPLKVKEKLYKTVVKSEKMYTAECWAINKKEEIKLKVVEMRMLKWMCCVTRSDKIRNKNTRRSLSITNIARKISDIVKSCLKKI